MNIVVTGSQGFIGKNLCLMLEEKGFKVLRISKETNKADLRNILKSSDFVFHLAGINRHSDKDMFKKVNCNYTKFILETLAECESSSPIMFSSSTQIENNNIYGNTKLTAEKLIENHGQRNNSAYYIYRFPNVFGKWCKPNYNSFVSTFCHNIANDKNIDIHDPSSEVSLVYIDDLCNALIGLLEKKSESGIKTVLPEYKSTVGEIADMIYCFKESRNSLITEDVGEGLPRALYSTYLSYIEPENFSYAIPSYEDERGIFCEMLKTKKSGQFSFFTARPGIIRGGHYHHTKNEKFLVIKGNAMFKFENIDTKEIFSLKVDDTNQEIVETIPGWSHEIKNVGDNDLVVMLWANEIFNKDSPDTITSKLTF